MYGGEESGHIAFFMKFIQRKTLFIFFMQREELQQLTKILSYAIGTNAPYVQLLVCQRN